MAGSGNWHNVFDFGDWDIYVMFVGITEDSSPNSRDYFVKAEDLDPEVGAVVVHEGTVILALEPTSGAGGQQPYLVLLPKDWDGISAPVRATVVVQTDDGDEAPNPVYQMRFTEALPGDMQTRVGSGNEYEFADTSENFESIDNSEDPEQPGVWMNPTQLPSSVEEGNGFGVSIVGEGF